MDWTTKVLVIANRTVGSDGLRDTLLARAGHGPLRITLVAPAVPESGDPLRGRAAAAQRLEEAVARLRADGLHVEGVLGDADPMLALSDVWDPRRFDEVIVSTLPSGTSRWLAYDLPHRIERFTGARVTHVVSEIRQPLTAA